MPQPKSEPNAAEAKGDDEDEDENVDEDEVIDVAERIFIRIAE